VDREEAHRWYSKAVASAQSDDQDGVQ